MNAAGANIYGLLREARRTGSSRDWPGDAAVADAVVAVFGDSVIAGLPEAEKIDEFAVAVTTSWVLLSAGEEYFAGVDLNFPGIDPNSADGWGVSEASMERLLLRVTDIYEIPGCPEAAASLAAFVALSLDEHAERAVAVLNASRGWFGGRPSETPSQPDISPLCDAASAVTWIQSAALSGGRHGLISGSAATVAALSDSPQADHLFAEFGYMSLWRDEHADALAQVLEVIYPYCSEEAAESPAPEFPSEPFSADEDLFFRQVVADRLCKLWTARPSTAMPWPPTCHQALLPFASYVARRAAADHTRDLAVLLGNISLAARREALRRKRLRDWVSQIPNAGQFARRLYRRGIFAAPVLGALFALIGEVIPEWLAAVVATCGLIAVVRLAFSARRSARYTTMTYPVGKSLLAGILLSALYCAGEACSLWLQNGHIDGSIVPGVAIGFVTGTGVLTLGVRYGATFKVSPSVFLPEGAPDDLVDELSDKLSEWVASRLESADSSWEDLFEQETSAESRWAPSPLGRPQEVLAASSEAVEMFRRLAQANPVGFDPGFGASLHEYSVRLHQGGRPQEAVVFVTEAVRVRSRLVKVAPEYEPVLGNSLRLLSGLQSDAGRPEEALADAQRAVQIFRRLAQVNAASYQVLLAHSLRTLGQILMQIGQSEDGLACEEEAIRILRPLAQEDADLGFDLSLPLTLAGAMLSDAERSEEGLACEEEAIRILRALPQINQEIRGRLGRSLTLVGRILSHAGRPEEALASLEEAVRILRPMTQANPLVYATVFALALMSQGGMLSDAGRPEEALACVEEAVRILDPTTQANLVIDPAVFANAEVEAVRILRPMTQANPLAYAAVFGTVLVSQGMLLSDAGQPEEGLAYMEEAVRILRPVRQANPANATILAAALGCHGEILSDAGRPEEGLAYMEEAMQILRPIAQANPSTMAPAILASGLESLDKILSKVGRAEEGLACMEEAIRVLRPLAEANRALYADDLAGYLAQVSDSLSDAGKPEDGLAYTEEAARILHPPIPTKITNSKNGPSEATEDLEKGR